MKRMVVGISEFPDSNVAQNGGMEISASESSATEADRRKTQSKGHRVDFTLLLTAGFFVLTTQVDADRFPSGCGLPYGDGDAASAAIAANANYVRLGQVVEYKVSLNGGVLDGVGDPACSITNAYLTLTLPNGQVIPVLTNITLSPGDAPIICPVDPRCQTTAVGPAGFGYPYTISAADITNISFVASCPFPTGPTAAIIANIDGGALIRNSEAGFGTTTYAHCRPLRVQIPCVSISCMDAICENGSVTLGGTITNCSTGSDLVLTVSNFVTGTVISLTPATNYLAAGRSTTFSGSYLPTNPCAPATDTILVRGVESLTDEVVTSSCTATCSNTCPPQLTIIPSGPYMILAWPANSGAHTLQSTANLGASAVWTTNFPAPVIIGGQNVVIDIVSGTQQFYRLSQ